ncbi:unnamed protein product [Toxocara canis]|uniref:Uncharacterized protein n=1 Tax=Toxocara canis TaxID=6265 RepID=A0A183UE05_TOXCA|nr:unnamed protein product [Toxocara canis]
MGCIHLHFEEVARITSAFLAKLFLFHSFGDCLEKSKPSILRFLYGDFALIDLDSTITKLEQLLTNSPIWSANRRSGAARRVASR